MAFLEVARQPLWGWTRDWIPRVLKDIISAVLSAGVMMSQGMGAGLTEEGNSMQMLSEAGFPPKAVWDIPSFSNELEAMLRF